MTVLNTLARAAGLGLCVAAFSGTALADPGNGNGNGPATTPLGQEKKAEHAPQPAAAPPTTGVVTPNAHGQEHKAANAPEQAKKQEEKTAEHEAKKTAPTHPATPSTSKASKPAAHVPAEKNAKQEAHQPAKAATPSQSRSAEAHHHVIVCHRTGSDSNPYVVINIPWTAWTEAHSPDSGSHPDRNGRSDILLKDPASGPGSKDGFSKGDCPAGVAHPPASSGGHADEGNHEQAKCPKTESTTERVRVGIWHATGAVKDGQRKYVLISPSETSAHWSKHEDDIPAYETRTVVTSAAGEDCSTHGSTGDSTHDSTGTAGPEHPAGPQPQPIASVAPGTTPTPGTVGVLPAKEKKAPAAAKVSAGAVLGAVAPTQAAAKTEAPAGGVLGAVKSAPSALAETATSGTLPFTGMPLWIFALLGGGLLAAGIAMRRSA